MITTVLRRAVPILLFSLLTVTPAYAQYDAAFFTYPGFNGADVTKNISVDGHFGNFGWGFNDVTASASFAPGIWGRLFENDNEDGQSVWLIGDVGDLNWFYPEFSQGMASSWQIAAYGGDTPYGYPVL